MEILSVDTIPELVEYVTRRTQKAREEAESQKDEKSEKSEKTKAEHPLIQSILEVWDELEIDDGELAESIQKIVKAIIKGITGVEYDLPIPTDEDCGNDEDDKYSYLKYTLVVPLENDNDHSYPMKKPFLVVDKDDDGCAENGITIRGEEGNCHSGDWRYATDEEIQKYFECVPKKALRNLL